MLQKVAYWVATVLVALAYLAGGYFDFVQPPAMMEDAMKLGYPSLFFSILGVWKFLAGIVLLIPALPRAKEWAYAGILVNLTAASATHWHLKDSMDKVIIPLVILAIAATSWALRPPTRKLAGPWL